MILYSIPLLAVSLLLIAVLSERVIRYILMLSKVLGLSEMAAGFILLSVTTSLPELAVSTVAATLGEGGLSVGNVLGSRARATIVGFGTSLPELATTIQALKKKLFGMALGNLLGSCITNITLILGVSSLISFSPVSVLAVESIMFYVLLSSLSLWYIVGVSERITKRGALFLCIVYIL